MPYIWVPDQSSIWFSAGEGDTNTQAVLEIKTEDDLTAPPERIEIVPVDFPMDFSTTVEILLGVLEGETLINKTRFTLIVDNWLSAFPISITYRRNTELLTCNSWNDLPVDAEECINYVAGSGATRLFVVDVQAFANANDLTPVETETYEIQVTRTLDTGRDALVAAVNARRNGPHIY